MWKFGDVEDVEDVVFVDHYNSSAFGVCHASGLVVVETVATGEALGLVGVIWATIGW